MNQRQGFRPLASKEIAILKKLLQQPFRGRDELSQQLIGAQVRQIDDSGSLRFLLRGGTPAPLPRGIAVEATYFDDGNGNEAHVNILLHVVDGKLSMLEIYKDDGSKIARDPDPAELQVFSQYAF